MHVSKLAPDELRVFYAFTHALADPNRVARGLRLLSDEERARCARFRFEHDRWSYLLGHALVRSVLSQLTGVVPGALHFESGERGRPELLWPACQPRLRFNLSHTRDLCACAVTLAHDVGVDVEQVERRVDIDLISRSVFSPSEQQALGRLDAGAQRMRFFELWTLKEAYIKARGMGLALPLREITLRLARGARPLLDRSEVTGDDAERYWFELRPLATTHMLAVACAQQPQRVNFGEADPTSWL